jgi:hypothetical protein
MDAVDLYVLDVVADDIEDLDGIMRTLNSDSEIGWHRVRGRYFTRAEIVQSLSRLIREDLVIVALLAPNGTTLADTSPRQLPPGSYDDAWFAMTTRGRVRHSNWHPEPISESE